MSNFKNKNLMVNTQMPKSLVILPSNKVTVDKFLLKTVKTSMKKIGNISHSPISDQPLLKPHSVLLKFNLLMEETLLV